MTHLFSSFLYNQNFKVMGNELCLELLIFRMTSLPCQLLKDHLT